MAKERYYLFLTEAGLSVWQGAATHLTQERLFEPGIDGLQAFETFLIGVRHAQFYLLLDLPDEDCRMEVIPHISVRDRKRVLERKLQQTYRDSPYRTATQQGREADGRRDDRVLLAALTNPSAINVWVNKLVELDIHLIGIYSITLLAARHARRIEAIPKRALIISQQLGSGLRQAYIADGALRFSRLTPLEGDSTVDIAAQIAAEAARARQYLASLRAVDRTEVLNVVMLCATEDVELLQRNCPNAELIHYQFMPFDDAAKAFGVHVEPNLRTAEAIWLRLIAIRNPSNQYATRAQRMPYVAWQTGRALLTAGFASLCLGLVGAVYFGYTARAYHAQATTADARRAESDRVYAANVPKTAEGEPTPTGMKNLVLAYRSVVDDNPALADSMVTLSQVIERFPAVELNEMGWKIAKDRNDHPLDTSESKAIPAAPAVDANGALLPPSQNRFVVLQIRGRLTGYDYRFREALDMVDKLAEALASVPGAKVTKLAQPIDISPEGQIALDSSHLDNKGALFDLLVSVPYKSSQPSAPDAATPGAPS
ncbi:MAG: hypothetical protein JO142_12780 [Burkholderiales bacterium]|nr:hypothetical protein [Burkholderiales bacterium]